MPLFANDTTTKITKLNSKHYQEQRSVRIGLTMVGLFLISIVCGVTADSLQVHTPAEIEEDKFYECIDAAGVSREDDLSKEECLPLAGIP